MLSLDSISSREELLDDFNTLYTLNSEILNLFITLNDIKYNNNNKNSCHMDICSISKVLRLAYYGTNIERKYDLWNKTNLIDLIQLSAKAHDHRTGMFIRKDFEYNEDFKNKYENEEIFYFSFIPRCKTETKKINRLMEINFPRWLKHDQEDFLKIPLNHNFLSNNEYLYIRDESYFKGNWDYIFDENKTRMGNFHCGRGESINIPMMEGGSIMIPKYECKTTNSLIVKLEYKNYKHAMFIIMPNEPHTKSELIDFCKNILNGEKLFDYQTKLLHKSYKKWFMPKFEIETEWYLNSRNPQLSVYNEKTPYFSILFKNNLIDFSTICNKMKDRRDEGIELTSVSRFKNTEYGTTMLSKIMTLEYENDDDDDDDDDMLIINKSFIYMIMDDLNSIVNIGIFVG